MVWKELFWAGVGLTGGFCLAITANKVFDIWEASREKDDVQSNTRPPQATPTPPLTPPQPESIFEDHPSPETGIETTSIETVSQVLGTTEMNEASSPWEHLEGEVTLEPTEERSSWRSVLWGALEVFSSILPEFSVLRYIKMYNQISRMNRNLERENEIMWRQQQDAQITEQILRDEIACNQGPNLQRSVNETLDRIVREALSWQQ